MSDTLDGPNVWENADVTSSLAEIASAIQYAKGDRPTPQQANLIARMLRTWTFKLSRNMLKHRYYSMKNLRKDLGIAIPPALLGVDTTIGWPAKAVDALVARSRLEGFTFPDDHIESAFDDVMTGNDIKVVYREAATSELESSCAFITSTPGAAGEPEVVINAYPATLATGLWDTRLKRLSCGIAITSVDDLHPSVPTGIIAYFPDVTFELVRQESGSPWMSSAIENPIGIPLIDVIRYRPSLMRPFGVSRINRAVIAITDEAVREALRTAVGAELFTSPQRYFTGVTQQFADKVMQHKWDAYMGTIVGVVGGKGSTQNPTYGQIAASSMDPHTNYMRSLAARFSGETNIPVSSLGVVSENPSSAEAIYAAKEDMVIDAEDMNEVNGTTISRIARRTLAIMNGTSYADLDSSLAGVKAAFKSPAMPSIVSQSDAMTKLASVAPWIAQSDVFLEEVGLSQSQITRLRAAREEYNAENGILAKIVQATKDAQATKPINDNQTTEEQPENSEDNNVNG